MLKTALAAILFWTGISAAGAAPPPPPSPGRVELIANFFDAAPTKLPATSLDRWTRYISPSLKVYSRDKLIHEDRAAWLAELNASEDSDGEKVTHTLRNLQLYELSDGGIRALEWSYPSKGRTIIHGVEPLRFVTYYFDDKQLVRIVYDQSMAPYDLQSGKQWK